MSSTEEFSPLRIVKKCLQDQQTDAYRVYKNQAEFVTVEAATAMEACRLSGIAQPLRISRVTRFKERLFDQSKFSETIEMFEIGSMMEKLATITGLAEGLPVAPPAAAAPPPPPPAIEPVIAEPAPMSEPIVDHARHSLDISDLITPSAEPVAVDNPGLKEEGDNLSAAEIDALLNAPKAVVPNGKPAVDDDDDEWEKI